MTSKELQVVENQNFAPTIYDERWVTALASRMAMIHKVCADVLMPDNENGEGGDYGIIPGCGKKKVLKKSGAEKLLALFSLSSDTAETEIKELGNGHREYITTCVVTDVNGRVICRYKGSCSTMETKYRYRNGERKCPNCGKPTIIKGKAEFGGGWICFEKKGGCKSKFVDGDESIESQQVGRVENPDIADMYNTCLKMSEKRAVVGSAIQVTATGDLFTQDLDDLPDSALPPAPKPSKEPPTALVRPHKYEGRKFMAAIPKEDRASFWQTCVKTCDAIQEGEFILTSKPVPTMEQYLVGAQPPNPNLPFGDDAPAWTEVDIPMGKVEEPKETPQETVARIKEKIGKGKKGQQELTNGN